jgi:hypothetical protein
MDETRRPFLWDHACAWPRATYPDSEPDIAPAGVIAFANVPRCHPYSVLLPVGFTMPVPSPDPRCALTAPFHPYSPSQLALLRRSRPEGLSRRSPKGGGGRFVLCGTFPGVAPAGCYPAPYVDGARTFLSLAGAAVRPTDVQGMGFMAGAVKPITPDLRPKNNYREDVVWRQASSTGCRR